jgi:hypothetical protein
LPPVEAATASTSRAAIGVVALLAMVVFGGWPGLLAGAAVLVACYAGWRWVPRAAPVLVAGAAGLSYLAAGLLLALHSWNTNDYLANDFAVQLLCVLALGFTALGVVAAPAGSVAEPAPDAAVPSRAVRSTDS